ncbi:MAG: ferredoxin [Pseudomonadota bacterium]
MTPYAELQNMARRQHLDIFGGFHPVSEDAAPDGTGTLLLLGPHEPGFWPALTASPEWGASNDPVDAWSRRVIGSLANAVGALAVYPFGGPPWHPFIHWAIRTGRAWSSPVALLVHDTAGLMVSYRGALALPEQIDLPPVGPRPCETCASQPCRSACPVGALTDTGYNTAACHAFLNTPPGIDCLDQGCAARRACPISQSYGRSAAQSAYHMTRFHR